MKNNNFSQILCVLVFLMAPIMANAEFENPNNVGGDNQATMSIRLKGYIPNDLPAFNIKVTTKSPLDCTTECLRMNLTLNQNSTLLNARGNKVALKQLSENKEYLVDWVRVDAVQSTLIESIKLAKQ